MRFDLSALTVAPALALQSTRLWCLRNLGNTSVKLKLISVKSEEIKKVSGFFGRFLACHAAAHIRSRQQ